MKGNKVQEAAVLKYEVGTDAAPRVIAKGRGHLARKILEVAQKHNLPVVEDPNLVSLLMQIELDTPIPMELYEVVAEVYAWLWQKEQQ